MSKSVKPGTWYNIVSNEDGKSEILIYDEIGIFGVTAKDFITDLGSLKAGTDITVRINSPGGDVHAAIAMYTVLSRRPENVTTIVDGIAASSASIVFMAGKERVMPENTFLFLHNPWTVAIGTGEELAKASQDCEMFQKTLANIYAKGTGQPFDEIQALMDEESWIDAESGLKMNFATKIEPAVAIAACYKASLYKYIPSTIAASIAEVKPEVKGEGDEPAKSEPPIGKPSGDGKVDPPKPSDPPATGATQEVLVAKFGEELGKTYYGLGLTLEAAIDKRIADLQESNRLLRESERVPPAPSNLIPSGSKSFKQILKDCGGDYVKARIKFPAEYAEFMKENKE